MLSRFSRLLVVDDSDVMLSVMKRMLNRSGYVNLHYAKDGRAALDRLARDRFALIIADWQMQPMNGLELFVSLRESGLNTKTPFLMMTSHHIKFSSIAREKGLVNYLAKPFTERTLHEKMHAISQELA